MTRRGMAGWVLGLAGLSVPASARADHPYRTFRYHVGRDPYETRRREVLRDRLFELADRIEYAIRRREISRGEAGRLYRKLDDVRDFLRNDRYLDGREFDRRWDDLNDVSRDLRRMCGGRPGPWNSDRWDSDRYSHRDHHDYHDRYDHHDRYYDRSDRSDRSVRSDRSTRERDILDRYHRDR